tara:strand:+ start:423 stop:1142 length:720 start_codon:yes stop_codon:yes gene_type:complete
MSNEWANRYQCTEFLDKKITTEQLNTICSIIDYIPEPPPGEGWNRVLWFLLDKSNSEHRKITKYLVENIHTALQRKEYKQGLVEHFGMLLQAPYVLHGAFVRFSEISALSHDSAIVEELTNHKTRAEITVSDLKQYENLMFHAGSICTKIVDIGLDCCFIGANKGRFLNFPKLITNEEEKIFTNMIKEVFPGIVDNICPALSVGFGHGVKHNDPKKILTDGEYQWFACKDRKKFPNLFK